MGVFQAKSGYADNRYCHPGTNQPDPDIMGREKKPVEKIIHPRQYDLEPAKGKVYDKKPFRVTLQVGKRYAWCTCGFSRKQPFCDGAHKMAEFATKKKTIFCVIVNKLTIPLFVTELTNRTKFKRKSS